MIKWIPHTHYPNVELEYYWCYTNLVCFRPAPQHDPGLRCLSPCPGLTHAPDPLCSHLRLIRAGYHLDWQPHSQANTCTSSFPALPALYGLRWKATQHGTDSGILSSLQRTVTHPQSTGTLTSHGQNWSMGDRKWGPWKTNSLFILPTSSFPEKPHWAGHNCPGPTVPSWPIVKQ